MRCSRCHPKEGFGAGTLIVYIGPLWTILAKQLNIVK